jgi:spore maturation protein CgeB
VKILIVHPGPDFSVSDVYEGYASAFAELGHQVRGFNLNDRLAFYTNLNVEGAQLEIDDAISLVNKGLEAKCYELMPDVIVVVSGFFVNQFTWDLWKRRPHRTVCLFTESPYEDDKQQTLVAQAAPDLTVINDPVNLDRYRQGGHRVHYVPHSYRPDVHRSDPTVEKRYDFGFVGTGYPSRQQFFDRVTWGGLDVALAGHWKGLPDGSPLRRFVVHDIEECFDNEDTARLYQQSRVSANLYRAGQGFGHVEANEPHLAAGWAVGPREIELAATGTFFLREPRGEGDLLFPSLPTFTEPDEFGHVLRWALSHEDECVEAVAQARAAIADRTFVNHARRILALLNL